MQNRRGPATVDKDEPLERPLGALPGKDSGGYASIVFEPGDLPGYKLQFLRRTETLRPIPAFFNDNSRRCFLTRRSLLCGVAAAAVIARLPAQERPRRIVSTAPSLTEALFALGLGDQVVGVSRFCNFPPSVSKLPKVGTYISPNAEAIARLAPDLVVLQRIASEITDRLNALHIRFIEVPHGTLADVFTGIDLIANAAAIPQRAAELNDRIQRELTAVRERAKGLPSPRVLVILDRRPGMLAELTAVGPDNYLEQLLEVAGGSNVLAKPGLPTYPRIALETVLRDDPDMILDMSADMSGTPETEAQRKAAIPQVLALWAQQTQLKAVRTRHIIVGTSNALLVPGPRAPEAARLLFDYMHSSTTKERFS